MGLLKTLFPGSASGFFKRPVRVKTPRALGVCITHYYDPTRLPFLERIAKEFSAFQFPIKLTVVTNTCDASSVGRIRRSLSKLSSSLAEAQIKSIPNLAHPFFLGWHHFEVFRHLFLENTVSHFLYLEDDLLITRENISYWLAGREQLRTRGLIPSFFRVEQREGSNEWYSTDCTEQAEVATLPTAKVSRNYMFINLPNPYQGMYLMDRDLMSEHLSGSSSHPDFGPWGIREKAAQGLTFHAVPKGFSARNAVGYDCQKKQIDARCWVHHMANNYANNPSSSFGKITVQQIFDAHTL